MSIADSRKNARPKSNGRQPAKRAMEGTQLDGILRDFSTLIGTTNHDLVGPLGTTPTAVANHRRGSSPVTQPKVLALIEVLDKQAVAWARKHEHFPGDLLDAIRHYLDSHLDLMEKLADD